MPALSSRLASASSVIQNHNHSFDGDHNIYEMINGVKTIRCTINVDGNDNLETMFDQLTTLSAWQIFFESEAE